jgi:heat shock protein HslJ
MFKSKLYIVIAVLGVLALVTGACAQTTPTQAATGTLKVYVTDARSRETVTSIMVTVSEVQIHKALAEQEQEQQQSGTGNQAQEQEQEQQQTQQGEGEWISVNITDDARTFDLLDIEGIEQYLGQVEVEAVKYTQVRLVVDAVQVEFNDSGELEDARIPSKELKIVHPFNIVKGETTALVIDFDADKMVTVTGSGDIIVKPVVKLAVRQEKSSGQKDSTKQELTLEDTKWILLSYGETGNLTDVLANTEITAEFVSAEGTVKGSAGCNSYFGSYEVEGGQLLIPGPVGATEMYCMEPEGVMDQEQKYLATLQLAESYEIDDDELSIRCGSQVLIFRLE